MSIKRRACQPSPTAHCRAAVVPDRFHAFSDLEEDVRQQIEKARSHPWVPKNLTIRGFVYDVKSVPLTEVSEAAAPAFA